MKRRTCHTHFVGQVLALHTLLPSKQETVTWFCHWLVCNTNLSNWWITRKQDSKPYFWQWFQINRPWEMEKLMFSLGLDLFGVIGTKCQQRWQSSVCCQTLWFWNCHCKSPWFPNQGLGTTKSKHLSTNFLSLNEQTAWVQTRTSNNITGPMALSSWVSEMLICQTGTDVSYEGHTLGKQQPPCCSCCYRVASDK